MTKNDKFFEEFIKEINEDKPQLAWKSSKKFEFTYLVIEGAPEKVWFIKHSFRNTYKMHKCQWEEVDVVVLTEDLQKEFEKLWNKGGMNFDDYIEKKKEKEERICFAPNFDNEEIEEVQENKRKKRKFRRK